MVFFFYPENFFLEVRAEILKKFLFFIYFFNYYYLIYI